MSQLPNLVIADSSRNSFVEGKSEGTPACSALASLTATERKVLSLIAEGCSQKIIAAKLHRSIDTVRSHRKALGKKLGLVNCVELARVAIEHGLASVGDAPDLEAPSGMAVSGNVAAALIDEQGKFASFSPEFARLVGGVPDAIAQSRLDTLMQLDSAHQLGELLKMVVAGSLVKVTAVVRRDGQTTLTASASFLPFCPPMRRVYVVLSDIVHTPQSSETAPAHRSSPIALAC